MGFRGRLVPPAEDKEEQELTMNPVACGLDKRMEIWQVFSAFHQRRKQRRRRPWGRGEQAAVRRESLL